MLITEFVEVVWSNRNKEWFIDKGYEFTNLKDSFLAKTMDLTIGSHQKIEVICDYCNKPLMMEFRQYLKQYNKSIIKEDCCTNCGAIKKEKQNLIKYGVKNTAQLESTQSKMKETNILKYGVANYSQTKEYKEKVKSTNLERYGVEHYSKTDEFKVKTQNTMNERYGVDYYTQTDEYKERVKATNLQRYGVNNPMQNIAVRQKGIKTNLERYGVENVFQSEIIKEKIVKHYQDNYGVEYFSQTDMFKEYMNTKWEEWRNDGTIVSIVKKRVSTSLKRYGTPFPMQNPEISKKAFTTMYKNGTAPCSKQQHLIHKLVGGELNLPVGRASLDIAFPDEKIYIEYDGGGHDLSVLMGNISREEFDNKERRRGYFLANDGWKEIRIITKTDILPDNLVIIDFVNVAKSFLIANLGFSVRWDLNSNNVLTNYKHSHTLAEFFEKYGKKEVI